jgi:ATP-binding cassette, subfamily B, bacterial
MTVQIEEEAPNQKIDNEKYGVWFFYKKMFRYLKKYPQWSIPLTIITVIMVLYSASIPLITRAIFDDALTRKDTNLFLILLSILIFGFFLLAILWVTKDILQALLGVRLANHFRGEMFKKIHELSQINYRRNMPGNLLHRFENYALMTYVLTQTFWSAIRSSSLVIIAASIMIYLNWAISILVFIIMPLTFFSANRLSKLAENRSVTREKEDAGLFHMVREDIDFHSFLPILRLKKHRITQFKQQMMEFEKKDTLYNTFLLFTNTSISSGVVLLQLLIIVFGSYGVFTGSLSFGAFVAYLTIYTAFSYAVNNLGEYYPVLTRASHLLFKIEELLEFPTENQQKILPDLPRLTNSIRFDQVCFAYTEDHQVLKNMEFEILAGESVAIIGASGSGKSTLLDLLLRQEKPGLGKIELDGKDIWLHSQESLYSQIGIVPRRPGLFLMSIRDNIRMGKLDATLSEIIEAAKAAEIHDEIMMLPDGYDTLLVFGGSNLSSGQMQRIVLARALVSNPAILVLDEATSALDAYNQEAISATLNKQAKHRTTIVVTHHLKEVTEFKKIIFLEKGQIVETGSHEELINKRGKYYQLWEKQSGVAISNDKRSIQVKLSWLRNIPIFEKLDDETLDFCVKKLSIQETPSDQVIFEQGSIGKKFYIIVNGRVAISKKISENEIKTVELEDGDFFGEIALLHSVPRTARATTLDACNFLVLHQTQFSEVLEKLPDHVRTELQKIASERLQS